MKKALLQFTNKAGVLQSARGGTSSELEFGVRLGAVFETTHGSYSYATGASNSAIDEVYRRHFWAPTGVTVRAY